MMHLFKPWLKQSLSNQSLWLLMVALSLAICATTALKLSNTQIQQAVSLQAAQMLAADLSLSDQQPIAPLYLNKAKQQRLETSEVTVFGTMARTAQQFVMVTAKAVEKNYPLRGKLQISGHAKQIQQGEVWLSPRAQDLLHVQLGDTVFIADAALKFTGLIEKDANQEMGFSGFAPMVIFAKQDIAQTHAIQTGSRIEYRLLMSGTPEQLTDYQQWFNQQNKQNSQIENDVPRNLQLKDAKQSNSRLLKPLLNLDLFLQLSNLVTLLLCGIAIALASRRYVQQSQDQIALLRCLGASKVQIIKTLLLLFILLMVVSAVLGCFFGLGLGVVLLKIMLQLMSNLDIQLLSLDSILPALGTAFLTSGCILLGFIVPSIYQLFKVPPIRVIRPETSQQRAYFMVGLCGIASLVVLGLVLTRNLSLTLSLLGGIFLVGMLFLGILTLGLNFLKNTKMAVAGYIRLPVQMASYMTVLALAMSLTAVLWSLKTDLLERWQQQLPANTPNQFVYGLPPSDKDSFEQQLLHNKWSHTPLYPNIRARLIAKNGQPFPQELIQQNNSLRRELNLTQSNVYPADNVIVQGRSQLQKAREVSVEDKTAQALGIQLGDELTFALPEGNLNAHVVNSRKVTWESFSPNFFFIFSPQTMDDNTGSYLGSFYVPPQQNSALLALIQQYSTTVFIDIGTILQQVKGLLGILVQVIRILAFLVALSGFLVLLACLNLLMDERKHEVTLLRAIGSSKQQIKQMFSIEFGFIGACAGIVACLFAEMMSAIVAHQLNLTFQFHLDIWLILPPTMLLFCILIARLHFHRIYQISPIMAFKA